MEKLIYQYFSDDDFWAIKAKIAEAELKTSGEIRVKIRERCEKEFEDKKAALKVLEDNLKTLQVKRKDKETEYRR